MVHDGDSIISALKALVELGCDGGLGNGRIWFLLDNGFKRVRESCPDDNTIAKQIGTTRGEMQSAFGRKWKTKLRGRIASKEDSVFSMMEWNTSRRFLEAVTEPSRASRLVTNDFQMAGTVSS